MPSVGTTTQRQLGAEHQQMRKRWARLVDDGHCSCARCGKWIKPGTPWDLDHTDDRQSYRGPAHASCNRAAGARRKNAGHRLVIASSKRW